MKCLLLLLLGLSLISCGGGGGGGEESSGDVTAPVSLEEVPVVTAQNALTPASFLAVVEGDPDMQAAWNAMKGQGFTDIVQAGQTEDDDGVTALWGEAVNGDGQVRVLVRHCKGDDCVSAIQSYSDGKASWSDAGGGSVAIRSVGLPVLRKELEGHKLDNPTFVKTFALELPDEVPEVDISARHFYVLNAFGELWLDGEMDLSGLVSKAKATGVFDKAIQHTYVRRDRVDDILLHSHPFDVVVWLGQGVREEAKTGQVWKPVGMTTNLGGFGDQTFDYERAEELLFTNPFRGPGLLFLAGCETMGDGNGGAEIEPNLPLTLMNGSRSVAGFRGCDDARHILGATKLFMESWLGGGTWQESADAANTYLSEAEADVELVTDADTPEDATLQLNLDDFWSTYIDADDPGECFLSSNVNIHNICTDSTGKEYQEMEFFVSPWVKNLVFDGPFFEGDRTNPDNNVDLSFVGSLTDIAVGAHFYFVAQGDFSPKMSDVTIYGDAIIDEIVLDDEKPDQFELKFSGEAVGSSYINENGDVCQIQPTYLLSTTGEPGTLRVLVPWKVTEE